jgi:hypothetical protein
MGAESAPNASVRKTFSLRRPIQKLSSSQVSGKKIENWLKKLTPTAVIPEKKDAYVQPRLADIREAIDAFKSGDAKYEVLEAADYR